MTEFFNAKTTAEDVAQHLSSSILGKTVIVTGASPNGLGAETARVIALHNPALLILAGRSEAKLKETAEAIKVPGTEIRNLILDLGDLEQVRSAAQEVHGWTKKVDVLVNNAAVMACPYETTKQGHELQFGTNHLGHFLFTTLLLPLILPNGRIVNVSSTGHKYSKINWEDLNFKKGGSYEKWAAYGQAKTANVLFSTELASRYGSQGLTAYSLHPGVIATPLGRYLGESDMAGFKTTMGSNAFNEDGTPNMAVGFWKTVGQGAATQVRAAFDPDLAKDNGSYLVDCQVANEEAESYAQDPADAKRLWNLSETLVGQTAFAGH